VTTIFVRAVLNLVCSVVHICSLVNRSILFPDKEGIAIILCKTELEHKYKALVQGKTILESSLHLNLSEHLNSEIRLGTITDVPSAKEWLRNSFFFRRIQKNPMHYDLGLGREGVVETWEEKMDNLVMKSVEKLQGTELIAYEAHGSGRLGSTEYGDIMSKVGYFRFRFVVNLLTMTDRLIALHSTVYGRLHDLLKTSSAHDPFIR
jgi:ATP-dependent DNA helicase HFM1/MER3